jgi:hypothetical protein
MGPVARAGAGIAGALRLTAAAHRAVGGNLAEIAGGGLMRGSAGRRRHSHVFWFSPIMRHIRQTLAKPHGFTPASASAVRCSNWVRIAGDLSE